MPLAHFISASRRRWTPASLGALAWWPTDPHFVAFSGSPATVTRWRNKIPGNSGGLVRNSTDNDPEWLSDWRGSFPAIQFVGFEDNVLEAESSSNAVISGVSGTNVPFTVLCTMQRSSLSACPLVTWGHDTGLAESAISIEAGNGYLRYERVDNSGASLDGAGFVETGTSIVRIGVTFDGARVRTYIDMSADLDTAMSLGACSFNRFRVGDDYAGGLGADVIFADLAVLPRAINFAEWHHYYAWSVDSWRGIFPPSFVASGTGVAFVGGGGVMAIPYPTVQAGDLLMLVAGSRQETTAPTTPTGWTLAYGPDSNPNATLRTYVCDTRATGSESGTFDFTAGLANVWGVQMYAFRGVSLGSSTMQAFLESASTTEVDGPGTLPAPTISPRATGRLAVAVVGVDNNPGLSAFSGASGGGWIEASEFATSAGGNFTIQVQVAPLAAGTQLSGGGLSLSGSDSAICRGFALVGL